MKIIIAIFVFCTISIAFAHDTPSILDGSERHGEDISDDFGPIFHAHLEPSTGFKWWYIVENDEAENWALGGVEKVKNVNELETVNDQLIGSEVNSGDNNPPNDAESGNNNDAESITENEAPSVASGPKNFNQLNLPVDFHITHIRLIKKPYSLLVYVRNNLGRFVKGIQLQIVNANERVTFQERIEHLHFSPHNVNVRRLPDYISPTGTEANNLIIIAGNHVIANQKYLKKAKRNSRIRIGVRQFRSRNIYAEDSTIRLLWNDNIISEYPQADEEEVAAAPSLQRKRKFTTVWAALKRIH